MYSYYIIVRENGREIMVKVDGDLIKEGEKLFKIHIENNQLTNDFLGTMTNGKLVF
jgi:hypothetical protein